MKKSKKAIALIELIFAIVVIGITLMSVPNLITISNKSAKSATIQESVSNAVSYMELILSSFWDEKCTNVEYGNPILYVRNGDSQLEEAKDFANYPLGRRVGSAITTSRRFGRDMFGNKIYASSSLGSDPGESPDDFDDVDDFNNHLPSLINNTPNRISPREGDYKDTSIYMLSQVYYISDEVDYDQESITYNPFSASISFRGSTNIKRVFVRLFSNNDPDKTIILKAFSCNIGSAKLKEKLFLPGSGG